MAPKKQSDTPDNDNAGTGIGETPKLEKDPTVPAASDPRPLRTNARYPQLGDIVLYTNRGDKTDPYPVVANAAIVTRLEPQPLAPQEGDPAAKDPPPAYDPMVVSLTIFRAMGHQLVEHSVGYSDAEPGSDASRGKWSWPRPE